jgi:hypothetical protein
MADYNGPGNQSPGGSFRSAPYSRVFADGADPGGLIGLVEPARGAASGAILIATATTVTFTYLDSTATGGGTFTSTQVVGNVIELRDIAITSITENTGCIVLVYWHGQPSK